MPYTTIEAKKKKLSDYYSLTKIHKACPDASYYMIYSGRSDGKTYSVLEEIVKEYFKTGRTSVIIRRWVEDFKKDKGPKQFAGLVRDGLIVDYSNGEWTGVYYYSKQWYMCKEGPKGEVIKDIKPFCVGIPLIDEANQHTHGAEYDDVKIILFDEFISANAYIINEFVTFQNLLTTIIRKKTDVVIYMTGNTINPYNPYFEEMGLVHAGPGKQEQGTIDIYTYRDKYHVAVEYAEKRIDEKNDVNKYFCFDNPKLKMITEGAWEIANFPHCPIDSIKPKNVKFKYFLKFKDTLLQCEIVMFGKYNFTYIHPKTTELKDPEHDLIFDTEYNPLANYGRNLTKAADKLQQKILWYYRNDKVFYSDNMTGEIVRNYLLWSRDASVIN